GRSLKGLRRGDCRTGKAAVCLTPRHAAAAASDSEMIRSLWLAIVWQSWAPPLPWQWAMAARLAWRSHEQWQRARPTLRRAPLRSSATAGEAPNARHHRAAERHNE